MSLTYPDGRSVYRNYDQLDRLTQTGENSFLAGASKAAATGAVPFFTRPRPYFSGAVYYPAGELNSAVYGTVLNLTTTFNNRQDMTALTYTKAPSQRLWSKGYSWDRNGANLLSVTDQIGGNVRQFSYDYVNRLTSTMDSSGTVADTYTFDAWGNHVESGTFNFAQSANASNRISATGYVYDLAGNMTADGLGNTYSYDADGKMSASNGATYTRDSFGQRVRKDGSGAATEYYYFGGQLLATRNPSSSQWTDYIYAGSRLIAEVPVTGTDTPFYRIGDHLDSLAGKTDSAGNVLGVNDVSPYGELFSSSASDPLLFTQHERDAENGSDSALYRQYASTQGRWLSPDPYNGSYDLADPQSFNRYTYLSGRPQGSVDPDGLYQLAGGGGGDEGIGGLIGDIFDEAFSFLFGGGGGTPPRPHTNVDSGYGNPYNSNGLYVFSTYVYGSALGDQPVPAPPFIFHVSAFDFSLRSPRVSAKVSASHPDVRSLPSCRSLGFETAANDLNPFSPSAFTSFDLAKDAATVGSMWKFNQALSHSINRGLTYPNKSSIFRGLMSDSATFAKFADAVPLVALDVAVIHGIYTELTAQCSVP